MGEGIELADTSFQEAVRPLVEQQLPASRYAAALIGPGSEVLGHDDLRSRDHDWGPRLQIFLDDGIDEDDRFALDARLADRLPERFGGYPVRFALTHDATVRHHVQLVRRRDWFTAWLGFDPLDGMTIPDWVSLPSWRLAEITSGRVFHDGPGELTRTRAAVAWYPDDVWRWTLAAQWRRIAEAEAFAGRCAECGDALGSLIVVARIAEDIARLWLLQSRRYPPYLKWLGTAFAAASEAAGVIDDLVRAISPGEWKVRERHLCAALVATARRQNALGLAPAVDASVRPFHDRPFLVLDADRIARNLVESVADPDLRSMPLLGVADQFLDNLEALGNADLRRDFAATGLRTRGVA